MIIQQRDLGVDSETQYGLALGESWVLTAGLDYVIEAAVKGNV